MSEKLGL